VTVPCISGNADDKQTASFYVVVFSRQTHQLVILKHRLFHIYKMEVHFRNLLRYTRKIY